jgi:hypothetical protein
MKVPGPKGSVHELHISSFTQEEINLFLNQPIGYYSVRIDIQKTFNDHYIVVDHDFYCMIYLKNAINEVLYK